MLSKSFSVLTLTAFLLFAFNSMVCASTADAKPLLHPLFTDHAVLQRDARVPVWGWTSPGTTVIVSFAGQKKSATASSDGKWMAYLDPMAACSKGRVLKIQSTSSNQKAKITDILVGDVWICSGQSNMEMGIGACNVPDEIAAANFPLIRLLNVPKKIAYTPESTLVCSWQECSPASLVKGPWGGFSAVAFFFGRELHRELDVPVGLIGSYWGGTVCEAWTSGEAMASLGDFATAMEQVKEVATTPGTDKLGVIMDKWYQTKDPGTSGAWFRPETDISAWKKVTMPANWQACGIPGYEGIVWAQCTFEAPAEWAGKELILSFGTIGDCDVTWVNGIAAGRTDYYDEPRIYKVPAAVVKTGSNVIAMRVVNSGGGGFFGPVEQMKVYPSGDESSAITLAGPWRVQETATRAVIGAPLVGNPNICSVLYNGMIAPLIPFAIKGAIWYQGEANASRAYQYNALLQTMIRDWRSRFGIGDFGFHIVSLANFMKTSDVPQESAWAELREAQAMAAKALPNCGIAMAIDIGDAADIHPRNKQEVGRRLALSSMAITYGKNIEWSGPRYKSMEINGKGIRLSFDHARSGLIAKGEKLIGFAIAGADRKFVRADAVTDGTTVLVSSPAAPAPVAVRYGWDSNPVCNLYNKENLPAVPFRTDDWPGVTKPTDQQVIYPPAAMPIVDMHTHMDAKTQYAKAVEAMDQWGGTISITLTGLFWVKDNNDSSASPASVKQIPYNDMVFVKEKLDDRILFAPGAFTIPTEGIWWGVGDIETFKKQGFVGLKLWPHGAILSSGIPLIHEHLDEAGRQGMPLIGYHTGDPGTKDENSPAFPKFEDDAVDVAKEHPQTTFIFAHGLFMLENDQGLDKLAGILDQYPNVFVDLAFTHNMRPAARYTVSKARDFYIKYRDRLLFGSDVFAAGAGADGFLNERKVFETNQVTNGLHRGPLLEGFNLPDSVLNHIYYWNAARLIPRVREMLESRGFRIGYELGCYKFDRLPPDVTVNKLTVNGQTADITGTLGSVTTSLVVEIGGKVYAGIDNMNGTWKLPGDRIAGLPAGTYDVTVTATNSIGLIRTDSTTNELKIVANRDMKRKVESEPADPDKPDVSVWKNIKTGIHSGFGSIDVAYSKSIPPAGKVAETINLQGWKGERVNCLLLVWSAGKEEEISIKASGFQNLTHQIDKVTASISVVRYVLCDEFTGGCGARDKDKNPVHISPDLLSKTNSFTMDAPGTRPVWISVDIPSDMPAGIYKGTISRQSASGTVRHTITLEVLDKLLPAPSEWSFHLDLWQNPYSVARFHQVESWSEEHISLLRPLLTMLARAGQKCITTTLIDNPWAGQTYDPYGSMIRWVKKGDGTWMYDYSVFDLYVNLAMESGIIEQINCYSMVPVGNKFSWFDEKSARSITMEAIPGTAEYENIWRNFLNDFKVHLRGKGWLDKTAIALDEREEEEMEKMFRFIKETAPELKISMAGFYYDKINPSIYDFSTNWRHIDTISENIIDSRRRSGLKNTYYVACGIPKPNNFTFSPPAESCYEGWFASAMGFDGFLRWAYNNWVENPEVDSRYIRWPSGDTYFVYPDAQSSIRFERLREGIQDFEKIRILRKELDEIKSTEAATARKKLDEFLNSVNTATLDSRSAAEVVNEGKQLVYEIVKTVFTNKVRMNKQFGAYYTNVGAATAITGKYADIVVNIDDDKEFVFCKESGYLPYLNIGGQRWHVPEIFKKSTGDSQAGMDGFNKYSYVRIIENSADRIIVNWRYIPDLRDINFRSVVNEYFILTPDRKVSRIIRSGNMNLDIYDYPESRIIQEMKFTRNGIRELSLREADTGFLPHKAIKGSPLNGEPPVKPVAWWKFDEGLHESDDNTFENIGNIKCPVTGNITLWKEGISGTALVFDGYDSKVVFEPGKNDLFNNDFTIEAWVVLGAYPWEWGPVIDYTSDDKSGVYFGVNSDGRAGILLNDGEKEARLISDKQMPLYKWTHVAANYNKVGKLLSIYINGEKSGELDTGGHHFKFKSTDLLIGLNKWPRKTANHVSRDYPPHVRTPLGNQARIYGIEGLIDEVRIYDKAMTGGQIDQLCRMM